MGDPRSRAGFSKSLLDLFSLQGLPPSSPLRCSLPSPGPGMGPHGPQEGQGRDTTRQEPQRGTAPRRTNRSTPGGEGNVRPGVPAYARSRVVLGWDSATPAKQHHHGPFLLLFAGFSPNPQVSSAAARRARFAFIGDGPSRAGPMMSTREARGRSGRGSGVCTCWFPVGGLIHLTDDERSPARAPCVNPAWVMPWATRGLHRVN